jgi:DNA-binding transcriptional regulator YiaG
MATFGTEAEIQDFEDARAARRRLMIASNAEFEADWRRQQQDDEAEQRKMDFGSLYNPVDEFLDGYFQESVALAYGGNKLTAGEYQWRLLDFEDLGKPDLRVATWRDLDAMEELKAEKHKALKTERKQEQETNRELPPVKKASQEFKILLQQARMAAGLKQKDLASKIKVTANVISDWEAGKSVPSGPQRAALNRVLKVVLPK